MDNTQQKKILIVEDDQFLREFYQELLQSENYQVQAAAEGEAGLAMLREGGFNLVLLDIMLPKKDGLQILRDLKIQPAKQQNGPIVVLTNLGQGAIIKECFNLGAEGYLIKSALNPDEVLTEIKSFLQKASPAGSGVS
ncbi:response regulator transcription factor [Candidatus Daviesbacteria bacterium]|nr:response regulator transcription factor [Candidatus Daviesbacteria bacterium]